MLDVREEGEHAVQAEPPWPKRTPELYEYLQAAAQRGEPQLGRAAHVCPSSVVSSRSGARTSQTFSDLSTLPVAMTQSLYLHQSAVSTCASARPAARLSSRGRRTWCYWHAAGILNA